MRRREFLSMIGGAAVAWSISARAQERMRYIGALLPATVGDPQFQNRMEAFHQELARLGWTVGKDIRIDIRWVTPDPSDVRKHAVELVALAPDAILAFGDVTVRPLLQVTHTVPIVFPLALDPVGAGLVDSLARPGGNATGFLSYEYGTSGKWLELLKEIAPSVTRAAIIRDRNSPGGTGQFGVIQALAPSLGVDVTPVNVHDVDEIKRGISAFARGANDGLVVTASGAAQRHRDIIIALAAQYRLPAVYFERSIVAAGGLISYGADYVDQFRRAAGYVDRILKGENPADLPVQAPTKYRMTLNLKTAKALGLNVPATVLARVDEVIE
jgi:putative tryptophan/tyrosine transport system substrate-binding protein